MPKRTQLYRVVRGAAFIFVSIILLVLFFLFATWVARQIRVSIEERIAEQAAPKPILTDSQANLENVLLEQTDGDIVVVEHLIFLSFADAFTGTGWFDGAVTTMYHDGNANKFTLPLLDGDFDTSQPREVVSVNINRGSIPVREAVISNVEVIENGANVTFYLSNDGVQWHQMNIGEWIKFPNRNGQKFLWRARFTPNGDGLVSPEFNSIKVHYKTLLI